MTILEHLRNARDAIAEASRHVTIAASADTRGRPAGMRAILAQLISALDAIQVGIDVNTIEGMPTPHVPPGLDSRMVTLMKNLQDRPFATATVNTPYPRTPDVLTYQGEVYVVGMSTPDVEIYARAGVAVLKDEDVTLL